MHVNKMVILLQKKLFSGVSSFHDRIAHSVLNKYEQHYWQARREGLLTENDLKLRLIFVKDIKRYYDDGLWSSGICFYLDAEHIILKTNLMDQARLQNVWPGESNITALLTEIKPGIVAESLFFLLLYDLAKEIPIVSITRNLVVNYLLNYRKQLS